MNNLITSFVTFISHSPLLKATAETIYMVFISSFISIILGSLFGIILFLTKKNQPLENKFFHQSLSMIINAARSIPYIILMISILPLTRLMTGTTIGINAAIVPLTLAAIPFYARICDTALSEVSKGLIETAHAIGATTTQLITKVLIPESLPVLIKGMTLTIISLIGYSAMAGAVGGGGLGELAIDYGYQRFDVTVTLETVVLLIILVQLIQSTGDLLAKRRQIKPLFWSSLVLAIGCMVPFIFSPTTQEQTLPEIKVGVMTGWSEKVMEAAKLEAQKNYGIKIKIVGFNDYVQPNAALAEGSIDANIFQHVPYLNTQIQAHHYKIIPIGKTFVYPMGFYSQKISSIAALKPHSIIAMPNDPSNENRSLLLLQKAGLITLRSHIKNNQATLNDIDKNPLELKFTLLDAALCPRTLKDADLVALTNDYTTAAGLDITKALIKEGADSPYANIIVVRKQDKNNVLLKKLVLVMHSKTVLDETDKLFPNGAAIAAWE